jgi:POT family proton-dependent oligopeptide transporter
LTDVASPAATPPDETKADRGFFGHPRGLSTLWFTEFWERVSYYGMRAILLFYMYYQLNQGGLGLPQHLAQSLMSIYGALVFMSSVIGGWLADRIFGSRRAILAGGVLIMFGHICLSVPTGGVVALYLSMVLITLGTGLLKPNISKVVGDLYSDRDERRDAGFSLFYMGVNLGAFIAPLAVGGLRDRWGFHAGFSLAAVGMAIALVWYVVGGRLLGDAGRTPANRLTDADRPRTLRRIGIGAAVVAVVVVVLAVTHTLSAQLVIDAVSVLGILLPAAYFTVMLRSPKTTPVERSRVLAYIPLFIASLFFWLIEEQGSVVLATFADQRTDLSAFGFRIPPEWFQSINPLAIVLLAPVFVAVWTRLGDRAPSTPRKFSFGLMLAGLSYLFMMAPGLINGTSVLASPLWLVGSFVIVIIGELFLSPVGLSATTRLAPAAFASQMMSLWFLSDAAAQGISAQIVPVFGPSTEVPYFGIVGGLTVVLGIVLYFVAPLVQRAMRGVH